MTMSPEKKAERLRELDEAEAYARYTLKKLDYPEGSVEYMWWLATWFSGTRRAWRSGANRALRLIHEEREKLKE
ncbi:MAG TPA: hypothetical protein PKD64_06340 [Pirellulaceae bacterium]|nr:hypothetical protein [Pirellulaceae bacterium]HMO91800.1 hypothetical protein [Pirellulaceae bacterium]HMP69599.1 hypothetical protein [Pirellulaceae bacterium]